MAVLRARLFQAAAIACVFAMGMTALLNQFKFVSATEAILQSRMLVFGANIESSIQNALALGLPFSGNPGLAALIVREKGADPLIRDIDVFDSDGRIAYSTDPGRVGQLAARDWLAAAREAERRPYWRSDGSDHLGVGIGLQNNFDVTVGQLLIRYSRASLDQRIADMGRELLRNYALGLALALVVLALVLNFVFRRFARDLQVFEQRLATTLASDGAVATGGAHGMDPALDSIGAVLANAHAQLDELERELERAG